MIKVIPKDETSEETAKQYQTILNHLMKKELEEIFQLHSDENSMKDVPKYKYNMWRKLLDDSSKTY